MSVVPCRMLAIPMQTVTTLKVAMSAYVSLAILGTGDIAKVGYFSVLLLYDTMDKKKDYFFVFFKVKKTC